MANVTNNSDRPLTIPGRAQTIPPGRTVVVDGWDSLAGHPVVRSWVAAQAIAVEEPEDEKKTARSKA